ncbi:Uncharacterized protein Fot_16968 [Forsythia ovata]|uniref:Uncharacterized protein n=1 Tax=Forsythia ovata TaxID=205694 RepID=A0ABD1VE26_9LAMI
MQFALNTVKYETHIGLLKCSKQMTCCLEEDFTAKYADSGQLKRERLKARYPVVEVSSMYWIAYEHVLLMHCPGNEGERLFLKETSSNFPAVIALSPGDIAGCVEVQEVLIAWLRKPNKSANSHFHNVHEILIIMPQMDQLRIQGGFR